MLLFYSIYQDVKDLFVLEQSGSRQRCKSGFNRLWQSVLLPLAKNIQKKHPTANCLLIFSFAKVIIFFHIKIKQLYKKYCCPISICFSTTTNFVVGSQCFGGAKSRGNKPQNTNASTIKKGRSMFGAYIPD